MYHLDTSTLSLLRRFENCELDAADFGHREHVRAAWGLLRLEPMDRALLRFGAALRQLVRFYGQEDRYHETITWAFFFLVRERLERMPEAHDWHQFEAANAELFDDHRALLGQHYSPGRLSSPLARTTFVLPDRAPEAPREEAPE